MVKDQLSAAPSLRGRYHFYARSYGFSVLILLILTVVVPPSRAVLAAVSAVLSACVPAALMGAGYFAENQNEPVLPLGNRDSGSGRLRSFYCDCGV